MYTGVGTDPANSTDMFLLGLPLVALSLLLVVLHGLRKAPEGYEDESGFHVIPQRAGWPGASLLPRHSKKRYPDRGRLDLPVPVGAGHVKG